MLMSDTLRLLVLGAALLLLIVAIGIAAGFGSPVWIAAIITAVAILAGLDRSSLS